MQSRDVMVYPNPAKNQLTIRCPSFKDNTLKVFATNVLGQEMMSYSLVLDTGGSGIIDITELPPGIYFLQLQPGRGIIAKMFVKE